jgi:biopolymer transport protein ExbB
MTGVMARTATTMLAQDSLVEQINYFQRFVIDGGAIAWFLILLSVAACALIIEHMLTIRTVKIIPPNEKQRIAGALARGDVASAWKMVTANDGFLFVVLRKGLAEASQSHEAAEYAIIEATEEQATKLLRKIEYLNIMGNVSPMIGLFGTVYGIILAFNKLVEVARQNGVSRPDQLAEGISVALVTTFWGLVVAIPALAVYGVLRNRIDALASQVATLAIEMVRVIQPEQRETLRTLIQDAQQR